MSDKEVIFKNRKELRASVEKALEVRIERLRAVVEKEVEEVDPKEIREGLWGEEAAIILVENCFH